MRILAAFPVGLVCFAVSLTGCNQHTNTMFKAPTTAGTSPAAGAAAAAPPMTNVPYVVRAQSAGSYIDFSIYNMGTSDLEVKKEYFALIDSTSRNVVPYEKSTAIIDLPQPAIVKPNDTLHGRAIFKSENSPIGKRLVFKPDDLGTFADINRATGMNAPAAAPAPAALAATANAPAAGTAPAAATATGVNP